MNETKYWIFHTYIMPNLYCILIIYHYNMLTYKSRLLSTPPSALYEFLKILDSFAVHSCSTLGQSNFWNSQLLNIYNYCSSSVEFQMKSWCITYVYMIPHRVCIITMDSIWVSFVFLLVFHVKNLPQGYCLLFFLSFAFCHENDAKRERKKSARERER